MPVASSRLASPASPTVAVGAGLSWRHAVGRHARLGKVAACRGAWNAWPVVAICATTSAAARKGARRRAAMCQRAKVRVKANVRAHLVAARCSVAVSAVSALLNPGSPEGCFVTVCGGLLQRPACGVGGAVRAGAHVLRKVNKGLNYNLLADRAARARGLTAGAAR